MSKIDLKVKFFKFYNFYHNLIKIIINLGGLKIRESP
jgi:hypothetical protein